MKEIETYRGHYYFQKLFPLFFGILFLGISLLGIVSPDKLTVRHNGILVESTFINLLPFIIIGFLSIISFYWLSRNYFRVRMTESGIKVFNRSEDQYDWQEIENLNGIKWPLMGDVIFRVKPKTGNRFYFLSDKPTMSIKEIFSGNKRTEMAKIISGIKEKYMI